MPKIVIQQATFERLQCHAQPFVDTPDTVIVRALDALDQIGVKDAPDDGPSTKTERRFELSALPSLTHTKVLSAVIDGELIAKPNWNSLMRELLRRAMKRVGGFENLQHMCPANMVKGRKEDEGYRYLSEVDISVQGQGANGACRAMVTVAQALGIPLDIGMMWRHDEAAAYPGERGRITVNQSKESTTTDRVGPWSA